MSDINGVICSHIVNCPFFIECEHDDSCEELKEMYCFGEHDKCCRKILRSKAGPQHVPSSLKPDEHRKAEQIFNSVTTAAV